MTTQTNRHRFSKFRKGLTWLCLFVCAFLPLVAVMKGDTQTTLSSVSLAKPIIWALVMIAIYCYARLRCSTEKWSFDEGLYYVASCFGVGSTGISFLLVLPAIFITLLASACIAAFNDMRRQKEKTPAHFYRLMMFFYHKRLNH